MLKPVTLEDGHTYDQKNIDRWFRLGHQTSPLTNQALTKKQQVDSLISLGVSKAMIRSLRLESDRIDKIIEINTK